MFALQGSIRKVTLLLIAGTIHLAGSAGAATIDTMSIEPPSPGKALALYLSSVDRGDPWSAPNGVLLEIDAYLPKLQEEGHLRAIRALDENRTPGYRVIHIEGDASVKQQVIARYLTAEQQAAAIPASSVAITPVNYKFRYVGTVSERSVYVFHITPRKKRSGLMNGELWIDGATGLVVHESGYLVKRPSIFIRRFRIVRDVGLRDGAPGVRTTRIEIDTRIVGLAALTITERPCASELCDDSGVSERRGERRVSPD